MVATMKIRPARPDEYEAIGTLTAETYRDLLGSAVLGDYEDELHAVADRAADCAVLVAVDDQEALLGAVTYVPGPDTSMSEFTDPDAAGIRMLCPRCRARCRRDGAAVFACRAVAPDGLRAHPLTIEPQS
jgi:hypothetical protein